MANRRAMFLAGVALGVAGMLGWQTYRHYRDEIVPGMASDEQRFVATVAIARTAWRAAPNDLARVGMRAARAQAVCSVLPGLAALGWTARIQSIEPDNFPDYAGKPSAHIVLALGPHLQLSTPAAPLLNLPGAMVEAGSPVYEVAKTLRPGAPVLFSARFFGSGGDCMAETSLTDNGAMTDPVFKIQLTALTALQ